MCSHLEISALLMNFLRYVGYMCECFEIDALLDAPCWWEWAKLLCLERDLGEVVSVKWGKLSNEFPAEFVGGTKVFRMRNEAQSSHYSSHFHNGWSSIVSHWCTKEYPPSSPVDQIVFRSISFLPHTYTKGYIVSEHEGHWHA